ncbi:hypothetical protein Tco_0321927 [Tanacetum coccineum]
MFPLLLRQLKLLEFEKIAHLVLVFLSSLSSYEDLSEIARLALGGKLAKALVFWGFGFVTLLNSRVQHGYVYFTPIRTLLHHGKCSLDYEEQDEDTSSSNEVNIVNIVSTASGHNSQGQASLNIIY